MEILKTLSRRTLLLGAPALFAAPKNNGVRVGCHTNPWPVDPKNPDSLMAVLTTIKSLGFEGFETGFLNLRSQFAHPDPTYDRIKKIGLRFLGIHVSLSRYDPQTFIGSFGLLQEVAEGGKAIGAERLIVSGDSTVHPLALRAKADALNRIAKHCKNIGLGCAYHNQAAEFADGGAQIAGLVNQTDPGVHFLLDAGQAIAAGADVAAFFAKNWRRIDGMHLSDVRAEQVVPLGQGAYDFAPLAKEMQAASWRGWLVTGEERVKDESGDAAVRQTREVIHTIFGV